MVLNRNKTQIMGLGGWRGRETWPLDWIKTAESLKIFGIIFKPTIQETIRVTWKECEERFRGCLMAWRGRTLNLLKQRVFVLNIFATSKLWYLAQVLPITKTTLTFLEREVGTFLWKGRLERLAMDEIVCDVMDGGLGLPNIQAKCDALFLKQIVRILQYPSSTRSNLIYWLGLSIRSEFPDLNTGLQSEFITPYFRYCVRLIRDRSLSKEMNSENLTYFTTKIIYKDFNSTPKPPKIVNKFNLDWGRVWLRLENRAMSSEARDILFSVIHNIYPNKQRLHNMNLHPTGMCNFCPNEIQSNVHLFTQCSATRACWIYIKNKLIYNHVIANIVTNDFELFMLNTTINEQRIDVYCYIIAQYVLYVHQCIRSDEVHTVHKLRIFLHSNCPDYVIINI